MSRAVLVTGAGSGIGLASALRLAATGHRVTGLVRTAEGAGRLRQAAVRHRVTVQPLVIDLADGHACESALTGADFYALVSNAGYFNAGAVLDVPPAEGARQLQVMVVAAMRLSGLLLPGMRRRGEGRIVMVSSPLAGAPGLPMMGWYQAAKSGLTRLTQALRLEIGERDIHVVRIEPGATDTAIWPKAVADLERRSAGSTPTLGPAYRRAVAGLQAATGHLHAPDATVRAVVRAVLVRRPRAVYRVGWDARALLLAAGSLPPPMRERLLRRLLALQKNP